MPYDIWTEDEREELDAIPVKQDDQPNDDDAGYLYAAEVNLVVMLLQNLDDRLLEKAAAVGHDHASLYEPLAEIPEDSMGVRVSSPDGNRVYSAVEDFAQVLASAGLSEFFVEKGESIELPRDARIEFKKENGDPYVQITPTSNWGIAVSFPGSADPDTAGPFAADWTGIQSGSIFINTEDVFAITYPYARTTFAPMIASEMLIGVEQYDGNVAGLKWHPTLGPRFESSTDKILAASSIAYERASVYRDAEIHKTEIEALLEVGDVAVLRAGTDLVRATRTGVSTVVYAPLSVEPPFDDDAALIANALDATKKVRLSASDVTAGSTRVLSSPDADGTLAILGLAQTFTAKQTFSAGASSPGSGTQSEAWGNGASAGPGSFAGGYNSSANTDCVSIGRNTFASGTGNVVIGAWNGAGSNNYCIVIGTNVSSNNRPNSSNTFVAGSDSGPMLDVYFGNGRSSGAPVDYAIRGTGGTGANVAGGDVSIAGGRSTGTGTGGEVKLEVALPGSSGSATNPLVTALRAAGASGAARVFTRIADTAPADADLANNEGSMFVDAGALKLKYKDGAGTVQTFTLT